MTPGAPFLEMPFLQMPFLHMKAITKRYPGVLANDHVDLAVSRGEIHAVMGENGAGKSTLMGILYGLTRPDEGEIVLDGRTLDLRSPIDAIAAGLGMVHQAFKLFPSLTVWENVVYRSEPRRGAVLDRGAARRRVAELADRHGLPVDPDAKVEGLPVGVRQRIEILKALHREAKVLILDEPTAVLTPQERDALFDVMRGLAAQDHTILFVTHKIHEVLAVTDNVTVLRDGRVASRLVTRDSDASAITRAMTGRNVMLVIDKEPAAPGDVVLDVRGLTVRGPSRPLLDAVSLSVRAGEIVGVAGVAGNGQNELADAITGLRHADAGSVSLRGVDVTRLGVLERRTAGVAHIPEDRARTGTALTISARDNLGMGAHRAAPLSVHRVLRVRAWRERATRLIERFGVRIPSVDTKVAALSGGNLQKLVIARELSHEGALLVAEQPTRGVDVGAIEFIHAQLIAERDRGAAVLLISAELSEVMALADRIIVLYEGRIAAELDAADATEAELGLLMAGAGAAAGAARRSQLAAAVAS